MKEGYLILSTETVNDHGFFIPNSALELGRFLKNSVMLYNHGDGEIKEKPLGHWEDVHFFDAKLIGKPVFSDVDYAQDFKKLYDEGNLKATSLGGICSLRKTGNKVRDDKGKLVSELYAREDGANEAAVFVVYECSLLPMGSNEDCLPVKLYSNAELTKLSIMTDNEEEVQTQDKPKKSLLEALKNVITGLASLVSEHSEPDGDEPEITTKTEPTSTPATAVDLQTTTDDSSNPIEEETRVQLAPVKQVEVKEEPIVIKKSMTELEKEGAKLAPAPEPVQAKVYDRDITFSKLSSDVQGQKIIKRVESLAQNSEKNDFEVYLDSMLNESRFKSVLCAKDKNGTPIINVHATCGNGLKTSLGFADARVRLANNNYELTKLGTSADALASPELQMIAWLGNVWYKLFPNNDWKKNIPLLPAQMTGENIGLIWPNIDADPAIYVGALQTRTPYTYTDKAKSVSMLTFAMQPIRWTPLLNHTQPHDVVSTGWNQALMKFDQTISDRQLYILLSLVPAGAIFKSRGDIVNITGGSNLESFILNPSFTGNVNKAKLTDSLMFEHLFINQNFVNSETFDFCVDGLMSENIDADKDTKSLLTRFAESNNTNLLKYKRATFVPRSYYGLYDTATGGIVDPSGVIPATAQSIAPVFIPSQLGIAIGKIDVFFVQDPLNYGITQSMDTRIGITTMRWDNKGLAAYTYGDAKNQVI